MAGAGHSMMRDRIRSGLIAALASNPGGLALMTVIMAAAFSAAAPGFTTPFNLFALTRVLAVDIILGFSMMVVLALGGLNLAIGAIGVAVAMSGGWMMQGLGFPVPVALLLGLTLGTAIGVANGLGVVLLRVHSFMLTLATTSIVFGAMILLTQAQPFSNLPPEFIGLARTRTVSWVSDMLIWSCLVGVALWIVFAFTVTGREVLSTGANARAALLSGVRVNRAIVFAHALSGLLAGMAGLMMSARNGAAVPGMAGQLGIDWLLPALLAPILGGTLLSGGYISVLGTVLGATLVAILSNGLLQLQVGEFWVSAFLGAMLLAAILADKVRVALFIRAGVK